MTSKESNPIFESVTETVTPVKLDKTKNKLKREGNMEINDKNLDQILHNKNLWERKKHSLVF